MSVRPTSKTDSIGWNFDNSYARLPNHFYRKSEPASHQKPTLLIFNQSLAHTIGLHFDHCAEGKLAEYFSGQILANGSEPIAQAYAGHQYGHFTFLGDGRAHLLGEHITPEEKRIDIQLKGSGQTPYSRQGDGRATLGPMLREYIISEAMYALGIPTTRSLAVVATGDLVQRDGKKPGAILTRIAASHIRTGTFEYLAAKGDIKGLKLLADYTIDRHYPQLQASSQPYLDFFKTVMERHIQLVTSWLRIGFIHGVMNTDNMSIACETLDYGPCAFMDHYDPNTVFSSIDHYGRYAFGNQPSITRWNLAILATALAPLFDKDKAQAIQLAEQELETFDKLFSCQWLHMMRQKLGLMDAQDQDQALIDTLFQWLQKNQADYTNTFYHLSHSNYPHDPIYQNDTFRCWHQAWQQRLGTNPNHRKQSLLLMQANNPTVIPRNHQVEQALQAAEEQGDMTKTLALIRALSQPYAYDQVNHHYQQLPTPQEQIHHTFCGT